VVIVMNVYVNMFLFVQLNVFLRGSTAGYYLMCYYACMYHVWV